MRLQFVVKAVECFTTIKGLTIKREQGPIIGYVISKIFQSSVIIPKIVAFQASCLHWGHLEKWLIQFLNFPTHWEQSYDMRFPEFFNKVE